MMPKPKLPHLYPEITRHKKLVWYVRRGQGPRTRIREEYGTPEFLAAYHAALAGSPAVRKGPGAGKTPHTLAWAIDLYRNSPEWTTLAQETRRRRSYILQTIAESASHVALVHIDAKVIREGRDRRSETPHAANDFLKTIRGLLEWAKKAQHIEKNPAAGITALPTQNASGFHTWTEEEVARFEAQWALGTRQRLAFDIFRYTGLRRGDAVRAGRQHVKDGILTIRTEKTGETVTVAVLPPLAASIEATTTGNMTFLITEYGKPFSKAGFGNWFRGACIEAGCPGSAHGLRKHAATMAAENGATERQLDAMFGWTGGKMAAHYTRAADRKRMGIEGAKLFLKAQSANEIPRTSQGLTPAPIRKAQND